MSEAPRDPIGMRPGDASRSRTTRTLIIAITVVVMIIVGAYVLVNRKVGNDPKPSDVPHVADDRPRTPSPSEASPEPATDAGEAGNDQDAATQEEAEPEFAEADVRQEMCAEYARRYLKAKTGVELVRSVQLSQAASCGWNAMLHADAATHDFVPGALKVAQEMQAEDVPTEAGSSADSIEKIDRLDDRIGELDRKVDELRYRVR